MEQPQIEPMGLEPTEPGFFSRHRSATIIVLALFAVIALGGAGLTANETYHKDRIFHGVSIGSLDVGGLQREEARAVLTAWHDQWWNEGLVFRLQNEQGAVIEELEVLPLLVAEDEGLSHDLVVFDLDQMIANAHAAGRDASWFRRLVNQLSLLMKPVTVQASFRTDETKLDELLALEFAAYETAPVDAGFINLEGETEITPHAQGAMFDRALAIERSRQKLQVLDRTPVTLTRQLVMPAVTSDEVETAVKQTEELRELFPLAFSYHDPRIDFERSWQVGWQEVLPALAVVDHEGNPLLGVDSDALDPVWQRIESLVNEEPSDAKFSVSESGKVEQFQPSQKGYLLDREATAQLMNNWLAEQRLTPPSEDEERPPVRVAVRVIEPKVPTAQVNDLGITEILGVGYSNFSGSPTNRVHNIGIGADKLNGLLIEPGEEFSLLNALKPFTYAEGYLPELVIKGDKIEPEIGGGLCQIGSTTFRAAMKSGLPITQRSNHSLVVSYYNDPRNGNPGTDATIYDPAPDFRFLNDTGNSILIQTTMDKSNGDLYFTFWGTSDGRNGDYTEPVVSRWIGTGPTKYIETADLEPGREKCQGAHIGAEASFTYTVTMPDGEVKERVFSSTYRPLPTICLVGIDPEAENSEAETEEEVPAAEETPQQSPDEASVL